MAMELKWMLSKVLDQPAILPMPRAQIDSHENRSRLRQPGIDNREGRLICSYLDRNRIRDYKVDKELVSALT